MGAWFKVGDRIRSKGGTATATIVGSTFNSILQESEYQIQWDHTGGVHSYTFDEGHAQWEEESPATPPSPPANLYGGNGISWIPVTIHIDGIKISSCDHAYAWYHGITENFEYCTKCDEKKQ